VPPGRRSHIRVPFAGRLITPVGDEFVSVEALGGVVLLLGAVAALVWANVGDSYETLWRSELTIGVGDLAIEEDLRHWVNDGLMAIFFFVVGLEIKRELVHGDLRDARTAALPIFAAAGGMVVPALIYLRWNAGGPGGEGWGIPMATDLAFALGVLALLRSRVPSRLKLFLLTLAIVDDVGAIIVIAVFYSEGIAFGWLAGAVATIGTMLVMRMLGISHPLVYVLPAVVVWVCTLESGVHATIAGVALGLLAPTGTFHGRPVIEELEQGLHPWTSFAIVPLFALANAGVALGGGAIDSALSSRITLGVVTGLVVGKTVGILAAVALALRLRAGRLPGGLGVRHLVGAGLLGGIGFTVSLFVADLSLTGAHLAEAKIGVLAASLLAGILGVAVLAPGRRGDDGLRTGG
jgi:NhaA family Na+:H+ antiporter